MHIYNEEKKLIIIPDAAIPVAVLSSFHDRTLLIDCHFKSDGMPAEHKTPIVIFTQRVGKKVSI